MDERFRHCQEPIDDAPIPPGDSAEPLFQWASCAIRAGNEQLGSFDPTQAVSRVVPQQNRRQSLGLMPGLNRKPAVKSGQPASRAFPVFKASHLPKQGTLDTLKEQPVPFALVLFESTVTSGRTQFPLVKDVAIGLDFALRVVQEPRPHCSRYG